MIAAQVAATPGVTAVTAYSSSLNSSTNMLTVSMNVQTANGSLAISTAIPVSEGFGLTGFGENFGE
jgi:hypothetical protein